MDKFKVVTDSDSFVIEASDIDICNDLIMFVGDSNEIIAVFSTDEAKDSITYIVSSRDEKQKTQNKFKVRTKDLGETGYEATNINIRNNIITLTDNDNKILYIFPTKRIRYIIQEGKGEVLNRKY
ncbi:hypothetical protein [Candidatus Electronema sp. JC]|uniref:hypothetical protein n=1 Tax=Candidatus Electronema sp. JC TaxID=3401570 RepID=UPI003B43165A